MIRDDACRLIAAEPSERGVFDEKETCGRMVFCRVRSVYSSEYWRARTAGVEPSIVFVLSDFHDYRNEKLILYGNMVYRIERTYINDLNEIELTCTEAYAYDESSEGCAQ